MISADWHVAQICLQVLAEQGPGMTRARERHAEDKTYAESVKALGG